MRVGYDFHTTKAVNLHLVLYSEGNIQNLGIQNNFLSLISHFVSLLPSTVCILQKSIDKDFETMLNKTMLFLGAWCAMMDDVSPFLQVDFKRLKKITRVGTQGRPAGTSYVSEYSLSHSLNGITWTQHGQVGGYCSLRQSSK